MARQGGMIEPDSQTFKLKGNGGFEFGNLCGEIEVTQNAVIISLFRETNEPQYEFTLDPESAPLFRMIANRLDEFAGKRRPKPWDDPDRSESDRQIWRDAKPQSLVTKGR